MTAEQSIRNIEREAGMQNVDNILGAVQAATEFKHPGGWYTDPRIPVGHAHVTYFPIPYSDETNEHTGRVLHEGKLFICIDLGSGESVTMPKRDCIITRGTGR